MGTNPSRFEGTHNPIEGVSWQDCKNFCEKSGLKLPSEAQWEYACRAGSTDTFAGTSRLDDMGWYLKNSGRRTHPVGQKKPNGFGLYDMHGNVWEWCEDVMDWQFYEKTESRGKNPVCSHGEGGRVFRGGSFTYNAFHCRASTRAGGNPTPDDSYIGFRPAYYPPLSP